MSTLLSDLPETSLVGRELGKKYVIEALIGEGAMGSVYRARQTSLDKTVAIKVLHERLAVLPDFVERFQREAFSASRLDHPNSLHILDFGDSDGLLYLVMEYVEGDDLLTVMQRDWPLDNRRIVDMLSQALSAIATAHDLGIVHRDIKPENILVLRSTDDEGNAVDVVKVCDFGIAKMMIAPPEQGRSFARRLTNEGFPIGTPDYMSPEQARGKDVDGRSDLYSIGVVLYHMLSGVTPFSSDTPLGVVLQHISDLPPPPSLHGKVHPQLEAVCLRALSKNPNNRFDNAREMRRALRAALDIDAEPISTSPVSLERHMLPGSASPVSALPGTSQSTDSGSHDADARKLFRTPTRASRRARALVPVALAAAMLGVWFFARKPLPQIHPSDQSAMIASLNAQPTSAPIAANAPPAAPVENDPLVAPVAAQSVDDGAPAAAGLPATAAPSVRRRAEKSSGVGARQGGVGAPVAANTTPLETLPSAAASVAPSQQDSQVRATTPVAVSATGHASPGEIAAGPSPSQPDPVAPPRPAAPALDLARASVGVASITTTAGIPAAKVRAGLSHLPLSGCYKRALSGHESAAPFQATLRMVMDLGGRVVNASLSTEDGLAGLRSCVESTVHGIQIRDVDTGDGSAVVTLTFSPQ